MIDLNSEAARAAVRKVRAQLDAAAIEALRSGMDWAEGPMTSRCDDPFQSINAREIEYVVEVRAGPIEPGMSGPPGWRVIRHEDWIAAGRPGDLDWQAGPDGADAVRYAFAPPADRNPAPSQSV